MKRWVGVIFLVALLGLIGWRVVSKIQGDNTQRALRKARSTMAASVAVAPVQFRDIIRTFDATGSVEAPLNVKIAAKVTGRIQYLQVHEGDRVKKGQVLVRIDPSDVQAEVRQQRANVAEAQYRLAQAQLTENPTNVGVNTQIRQQKAGAVSAEADYKQTSANYEAQLAAASAAVSDSQSKINSAHATIGSAKANLENARARYNRMIGLYKQGFIAAQDVDDAKAAMSVQEAAVEVANAQLSSATAQKLSIDQQLNIVRNKGKADIEASRAKMLQAHASVEYANSNTAQTTAYKQSIAALKAGVDAAKATLAASQAKMSDTVLVSPLDGYVTGRYADPGAVATSGMPIVAVQFMRNVWVSISVPEDVAGKIHIGQKANVKLDAYPDMKFVGSVIQVNPSADPLGRQFTVRIIMDNQSNLFKPGMFAKVSVEVERIRSAVTVPHEAIQTTDEGSSVFLADAKNKVHRIPVLAGASDAAYVAIEQGVKVGDKVVIMNAMPLRDGQSIRTGGRSRSGGKRGRK